MLPVVHPSEGCDDTGTVESAAGAVTEVDADSPGTVDDSVDDGGGAVSAALVVVGIGEPVPGPPPGELELLPHAPRQKTLAATMTANGKLRWVFTAAASRKIVDLPFLSQTETSAHQTVDNARPHHKIAAGSFAGSGHTLRSAPVARTLPADVCGARAADSRSERSIVGEVRGARPVGTPATTLPTIGPSRCRRDGRRDRSYEPARCSGCFSPSVDLSERRCGCRGTFCGAGASAPFRWCCYGASRTLK